MEVEPSCSSIQIKSDNIIKCSVPKEIKSEDDNATEEVSIPEYKASQNHKNDFNIPGMPEEYKETYEAYINKVTALTSVPIIESITPEHLKNFKHFNLRYYEDKYCINFAVSEAGYNDVLIRIHSNKLFLISLASGNDIIRCGKDITGTNFMIHNNDRSEIKLGGKRKKGAKVIEPHTILCQVKCEGMPKMFNIRAGVPGRIIEINEHVKKDPNLLRKDPKGYGYLAVVAPKGHPSDYEKVMNNLKLLSEEEYVKYLTERTPKFSELSEQIILKYNE
ncbi:protein Simiate [Anoplophora glabripennis]|uniref:protein Simiate n=1 Tax=Anoplophora glabripennis TaxID=217634 RepID=UPI0008748EFA|nr:protein Simiate [Anoplophora glabripennis]